MALAVENLDPSFLPKGMPTLSGTKGVENYGIDTARITIVRRILGVVTGGAAIIATFFIIYSGFNLVISHGEDDKMGPAKKGLTWALVGMVCIILSYSIMSFVIKTALTADDPNATGEDTSDQLDANSSRQATNAANEASAQAAAAAADMAAVQAAAAAAQVDNAADKAKFTPPPQQNSSSTATDFSRNSHASALK